VDAGSKQGEASIDGGPPAAIAGLAAVGYPVAAGIAVPMAAVGRASLLGSLHLLLAGFVVSAIVAVVLGVLPRFTGETFPRELTWPMALATLGGPGLLAVGVNGSRTWLRVGGSVEGLAVTLVGVCLVLGVVESDRRRSSFSLYLLAGLTALFGAGLGVGIVLGELSSGLVPVHGAANLLELVGLVGLRINSVLT